MPLWRRTLFSLMIAVLAPPAAFLIAAVGGLEGITDFDSSSETLIFFGWLYAAGSAFAFVASVVMVEFWWRRHPTSWMATDNDNDDAAKHEADYHGQLMPISSRST